MKGWESLSKAADTVGISRNTLGRWIRSGKITQTRTGAGKVKHLQTTLVNLAELRKLVAAGVRPGRPKKK